MDTLLARNPLLQSAPAEKTTLATFSGIVKQLKKERDRVQQQLSGLNTTLEAFARVCRSKRRNQPRRKMSARGHDRIAAAQRAR